VNLVARFAFEQIRFNTSIEFAITAEVRPMRGIIGWGCASLLGAFGWWLGGEINVGVALLLSAVASGIGLYYGQKWFDNNLG
jgi:hypothetical protein